MSPTSYQTAPPRGVRGNLAAVVGAANLVAGDERPNITATLGRCLPLRWSAAHRRPGAPRRWADAYPHGGLPPTVDRAHRDVGRMPTPTVVSCPPSTGRAATL